MPHAGLLRAAKQEDGSDSSSNEYSFEGFTQYHFTDIHTGSDEEIWNQLETYFQFTKGPHGCIALNKNDSPPTILRTKVIPACQIALNNNYSQQDEHRSLIGITHPNDEFADEEFPKEAFQLTQEIKANIEKLRARGIK